MFHVTKKLITSESHHSVTNVSLELSVPSLNIIIIIANGRVAAYDASDKVVCNNIVVQSCHLFPYAYSSSSSSSHDMISVMQRFRTTLQSQCDVCCHCQKEQENRCVAENDEMFGAIVTKSGNAFRARVAATGKERSPCRSVFLTLRVINLTD